MENLVRCKIAALYIKTEQYIHDDRPTAAASYNEAYKLLPQSQLNRNKVRATKRRRLKRKREDIGHGLDVSVLSENSEKSVKQGVNDHMMNTDVRFARQNR